MSENSPSYFSKLSDRHPQTMEDVMAQNRLLGAATDTLIARIERAEARVAALTLEAAEHKLQNIVLLYEINKYKGSVASVKHDDYLTNG